jgi:hypothetical protein
VYSFAACFVPHRPVYLAAPYMTQTGSEHDDVSYRTTQSRLSRPKQQPPVQLRHQFQSWFLS